MFLFEKILDTYSLAYPLPTAKGFVVYEAGKNKASGVEIISFFWESARGRPNYYNFRFSKLIKGIRGEYVLDHTSQSIPWDEFFDYWHVIKEKLKLRGDILHIASDALEAKWLLWRSFIVTQDYVLARYIHNFPASFYNSLDENLSTTDRNRNMHIFLLYLRDAMPFVYNGWNTYFESNMDYHFCHWFKNYYTQNDE